MTVEPAWILSSERQLTAAERALVWQKPASHRDSQEEIRIREEVKRNWQRGDMRINNILLEGDAGSGKTQLAKALSADFGLPYTKVTCFADMDKSDVLGAILPVLSAEQQYAFRADERQLLELLYASEHMIEAASRAAAELHISIAQAESSIRAIVERLKQLPQQEEVAYRYYASEIVRAFQHGYLLEIQEPTVIRDAAVLMALNSALEPDGGINLPTGVIHRHPDFIAVITTNRGYQGCRPLNEALRDRVQHSEKMDLPTIDVMVARAMAKTGYPNRVMLQALAEIIVLLDQTARANAIKGVAGMRSYFFWADAVMQGASVRASMYPKVIYKITTDADEIAILEDALKVQGRLKELDELDQLDQLDQLLQHQQETDLQQRDVLEIRTDEDGKYVDTNDAVDDHALLLRKSADSEGHSDTVAEDTRNTKSADMGNHNESEAIYHELDRSAEEEVHHRAQQFRKKLNQEARIYVEDSIHQGVKLVVHRPEATEAHRAEYDQLVQELMPVIHELSRKTKPLLEYEQSVDYMRNRVYGTKFQADQVARQDYRYFTSPRQPDELPTLAVALRMDESASMAAFGRLDAAKRAAVAVYEFCSHLDIPVLIYGDTADRSRMEQMSLYAYVDPEHDDPNDRYRVMNMQGRSNNRDGMALRIVAERLMTLPQQTKLLISISDGQPKALPDYSGAFASKDMQQMLTEYARRGITCFAAAIGQDKEMISEIYGRDQCLDISNVLDLPARLVQMIARYL